jgi:hypothetical protein
MAASRLDCVSVDIGVSMVAVDISVLFAVVVVVGSVRKDNRRVACAYDMCIRRGLDGGVVEIDSSSYMSKSA